jgi:nucleoside-diphosphate-sugar epimerase
LKLFANCDVSALHEQLSQPEAATVETLAQVPGDWIFLGAGGKMGPSLATMARRAAEAAGIQRRIVAVSRFSDTVARQVLEQAGVETISGDLLSQAFLDALPDCDNVVYMVGLKFGTSSAAPRTWAVNAFLPGLVCRRFARSRIVSFSTGNVYPLVPVDSGGSLETDQLQPVGEYGMSAVARERMFEYFSDELQIPTVMLRLNYATEMRYGVLVDLAHRVLAEEPIALPTRYLNCIWQGDANNLALRSIGLATSPPQVLNLTGAQTLDCRDLCRQFGELMNKRVEFVGESSSTALLSNASLAHRLLGAPATSIDQVIQWTASWVQGGGMTRLAPTHFEVRDGKF